MTENEFKELADLLYPNVRDIDYYINKYPPRQVIGEVTRLGPSPTGFLHIGQLYQSLAHRLLANRTNGIFYLRLEDTDSKREIDEAGAIAYEMLNYYGLTPDEGYRGKKQEIGDYGPYEQSKRLEIYHAFAHYLVKRGRAFPCFCKPKKDKEEIQKSRDEELEQSDELTLHDPCRNLTLEEIKTKIKANNPFALRLLSVGNSEHTHKFRDAIKGEKDLRENAKDDVLIKSNGVPVYSFAHIVDDTLMRSSIIVRGQEWYQSLPVHIELAMAFGFKPFKYAHTPNICILDENGNKRKISKRKDAFADVRFFIKKGYPVEAILEYLLTLLNSDFEIWRKNNPNKSIEEFPFEIKKIGVTNPLFDFLKLNDISKTIISKFSAEEVYKNLYTWSKIWNKENSKTIKENKQNLIDILSINRGGERPRKDIAYYSEILDLYKYVLPNFKPNYQFELGQVDKSKLIEFLVDYSDHLTQEKDNQTWFENLKNIACKYNFVDNKTYKQNPSIYSGNIADASKFVRIAITDRSDSPELYSIMKILGIIECKNRLNALISTLKNK